MLIEGFDQNCRYLSAPGCSLQHHFGHYLRQLKITIGEDRLRNMVRYGWVRPVLRVRLPDSFYLSWQNYPSLSFRGSFADDDSWANKLVVRSVTMARVSNEDERWYAHYLDDPSNELAVEARAHSIPTGPGTHEPEPIQHPRRSGLIYPWIDFFAYWQVYEMVDVLRAAQLVGPLLNEPDAEIKLEQVRQQLPEWREWS